jgi:RecB family exonuclease
MKLSYSSISTYETCPAKYKFQYEEKLPTTTSPALSFGDALHRTLHRFHDRPVPVAPSLEELHEMLDAEWVGEGYRDPGEESLYRDHARQVLTDYHRENAPSFRIPAALEFRFTVEI